MRQAEENVGPILVGRRDELLEMRGRKLTARTAQRAIQLPLVTDQPEPASLRVTVRPAHHHRRHLALQIKQLGCGYTRLRKPQAHTMLVGCKAAPGLGLTL